MRTAANHVAQQRLRPRFVLLEEDKTTGEWLCAGKGEGGGEASELSHSSETGLRPKPVPERFDLGETHSSETGLQSEPTPERLAWVKHTAPKPGAFNPSP